MKNESQRRRNDRLFNCCTNCEAPDWSLFTHLVIGGCKEDLECPGSILGGLPDDEAKFWTVYARTPDSGVEAITDCASRADVDMIAAELSKLSGMPILAIEPLVLAAPAPLPVVDAGPVEDSVEAQRACNMAALRKTLQACLYALNSAPNFTFNPCDNRLGLKTRLGNATSYDLASRVAFVLNATELP